MDTIKSSGFYEVTSAFFGTPFGLFILGLIIGTIIVACVYDRGNR